jgi:DNA-binding GntR family transcriptional regulator
MVILQETGKQKLSETAYQIVEELIVTLKLPPRTIFSETDLAEQIGIGRTPLREALKQMQTERLVVSIPRRGIMVTEINITDQLLLLETRRCLDRILVARAAQRVTDEQRALFQTYAQQIYQAAFDENLADYMRVDYEFDELVTIAARNPFAAEAAHPLHAHSRRFWYAYRQHADWLRIAELHGVVMNRIVERDQAQAAAASDQLIDYLEEFARAVIEAI